MFSSPSLAVLSSFYQINIFVYIFPKSSLQLDVVACTQRARRQNFRMVLVQHQLRVAILPAADKAKLFAKNFSKNSHLDYSVISLPVFLSRTNLKLHNISITPKMFKEVILNLDSSKAFGLDCIPVVVLKKCEPELLYILAELFSMCLQESCFPDC